MVNRPGERVGLWVSTSYLGLEVWDYERAYSSETSFDWRVPGPRALIRGARSIRGKRAGVRLLGRWTYGASGACARGTTKERAGAKRYITRPAFRGLKTVQVLPVLQLLQ
jgi:hypothetical protein